MTSWHLNNLVTTRKNFGESQNIRKLLDPQDEKRKRMELTIIISILVTRVTDSIFIHISLFAIGHTHAIVARVLHAVTITVHTRASWAFERTVILGKKEESTVVEQNGILGNLYEFRDSKISVVIQPNWISVDADK